MTTVGVIVGGVYAYDKAYNDGARDWELFGWTLLGAVIGLSLIHIYLGRSHSCQRIQQRDDAGRRQNPVRESNEYRRDAFDIRK